MGGGGIGDGRFRGGRCEVSSVGDGGGGVGVGGQGMEGR